MPAPSSTTSAFGRTGWWLLDRASRMVKDKGLGTRFPAVYRIHASLRRRFGVTRVNVLGHDFEVDPGDTLRIAAFGFYEKEETAWYQQNVRPGDTVLEVGANIGYFTLLFAKLVGDGGKVFAFEPDPEIGAILRRNIARNGYQNIVVRDAAAGSEPSRMTLHQSANRGDNRLFAEADDTGSVDVDVVRLDDELAGYPKRIDLMKMDIQGAEPLALAGMTNLLSNNPPRKILMEFWPHGITALGGDPGEHLKKLASYGYEIGELTSSGVKPVDIEELATRISPETTDWVNLVCVQP